jgi:hypothetical protein
MDVGLTPMRTTQKGADENSNEMNGHETWTRNGKPNRNDHMEETEIIILKKRRSNTKRTMTPGGETHFLCKFSQPLLENTEKVETGGLNQRKCVVS